MFVVMNFMWLYQGWLRTAAIYIVTMLKTTNISSIFIYFFFPSFLENNIKREFFANAIDLWWWK